MAAGAFAGIAVSAVDTGAECVGADTGTGTLSDVSY